MQWQENSIVLSSKLFTENSRIITVFNKTIGKTFGLVRGTRTPIQHGDISHVRWNGRTSEQLGTFKIENIFSPFIYALNNSWGIFILESVCFLCSKGLPEKAPHPELFDSLKELLPSISYANGLANYALFEVKFLSNVGLGLDLSRCALTGRSDDLFYVSPRTGRAATQEAGEKYKDRLFILPQFLISRDDNPTDHDIFRALCITEHFLKMYFCGINNGKLPLSRSCLMMELSKNIEEIKSEN
ncbi:MAG: DNA repair protein RecO [Holosporaceae bacterium]|nr:DNA repair protein RecO [Holosporaceae bacterium]